MPIYINNPQTTGNYVTYNVYDSHRSESSGEINVLKSDIVHISGISPLKGYFSNIHPNDTSSSNSSNRTEPTGASSRFYLDTYNNTNAFGSSFRGRRFRGTPENPSGVLKDDTLLHLAADGHNVTGIIPAAAMFFAAAEDWNVTGNGTFFRLRLTPTGQNTIIDRLWIKENGNVGISNTNPNFLLDVSGKGNFTDDIYSKGLLLASTGYVKDVSGVLNAKLGLGTVALVEGLAGVIDLVPAGNIAISTNLLNNSITISGESQPVNLSGYVSSGDIAPQNSQILRNQDNQITGIKYDSDFSRIYRDNNNKITGIYYNNYFKKILYSNDIITGVNIIYY